MAAKAWASFLVAHNRDNDVYRLHFNRIASKLFDGYNYIHIRRTNKVIVIQPLTDSEAADSKVDLHIHRHEGTVYITCNRLVNNEGFLRRAWFDGKRYTVKRGKGNNLVYIFMDEEVVLNGVGG